MALSQDLINQFAKLTVKEEKPTETTVNGTYKTIDGVEYVQIDGSEIWTPVTSTVEAETGERVKVTIKNHTATVTGNISSPSARSKSVQDLKDEVDEYGNTIQQLDNTIEQQGNSITQINNNIQQVNNTISQHDNAISQHGNTIQQINNTIQQQGNDITQLNNDIEQQGNDITQINNTLTQHGNTITQHGNTITQQGNTIQQQGNTISQQGNTIQQQGNTISQHGTALNTINSDISILNSAFIIEDGVLTGLSEIVVDELETNTLNAKYANIDFTNINFAAVRKVFSDSGIIKDLVVQSGKITGELVGVTIKGDLIEGNTVKAEKLVVKGEDGLYYKLNIDGLDNISTTQASKFTLTTSQPSDWTDDYKNYYAISNGNYVHVSGNSAPTWAANTYYKLNTEHQNGLDGTVIIAKSITADKVQVSDLVAFDATIGGFHIGDHSLYSGVKSTVNNTTRGVYLDDSGQVNIGDSNNFIKYFLDTTDNTYKLQISAGSIKMGGSNKTLQETIDEIESNVDNIQVGVRNLVLNSNFRKGKQNWSDWGNSTIREIVTINNKNWFHCITTNNNFVGLSQNRKIVTGLKDIEPNTQYTLSFTMYASEEYSGLSCGIHWNNDTTIIGQNWCSVNLATTPKRFTSTFTSPSDNTINTFNLMIGKGLNNAVLEYWITDIKLEKGNHSTDWTPAPEDVDKSIDSIEIGGRNLLQEKGIVSFSDPANFNKSEFKKSGKVTFTTSNRNQGFRFDLKEYYEPNSYYILSFYLTLNVISGELSSFNNFWHHDKGVDWENYCYIDNVKYNSIAITDTNVLNLISDGKKHKFIYALKSSGTIKEDTGVQYSYIQPGRGSTEPFQFNCIIDNLKLEIGNKATDWSPAPEDVDNMIAKTVKQVDVEYYLSTSSSSATGGSWSTTAPAWVDGKYMWSRQKVTYVDDTTATRNETCIAGAKGATGSPGGTGATGTGVESITEEYYLSTSKSSQTGGSWVTTPPTWSTGKYIWTRSKIIYKNPASTVYTTPVCSSEWEAVNNVNVGGTNLILKSSFLYSTEPTDKNWSTWTVNNINYRRFTVDGYEYKAASDNGAVNSSVGLRVSLAELGLKIGDTISISYDIKGKIGSVNNGLTVMHATAASSNFYAKIFVKVNGASHPTSYTDWTRIKGVWTIDSDFPSNNDYIYIFFGGGTGSEVDVFIRNVKVEKGNKPTEWSPAPKDVDNLVTDSIDNIQVGGTNRIIGSIKYREDTPYKIENATANDAYRILTDLKVTPIPGEWYILQVKCDKPVSPRHGYAGDTKGKFALFLYLRNIGSTQPDGSFDVAQQFTGTSNYETLKYLGNKNNTYYWSYKIPNNTRDIIVRVNTYASTEEPVTISWWDFKMEQGNKPTDWTPAPEDVDSSIGDVQTVALGAQSTAELAKTVANKATVDINSIKGYIQNLVVDQNGQSMMTQTGSGWQFNMGTINGNLDSLSRAVDDMSDDNQATRALLNNVKSLAESVADKTAYINVDYTTDASGNPIPRMILGAETSAFKIRITNESIDFMESDTVMAYATSNTFYNLTTVVQKELEIGSGPSFVWTVRSNGNLGLTYKS